MNAWLVIGLVALGSDALRSVMLVLVTVKPLPVRAQQALALVGPAAVGALFATMAFTADGVAIVVPAAELAALVTAFAVTRRTGNMLLGVLAGFPVLYLATAAGW
jgi:branched-subunit amino acid transport protein